MTLPNVLKKTKKTKLHFLPCPALRAHGAHHCSPLLTTAYAFMFAETLFTHLMAGEAAGYFEQGCLQL